jgi:hypothetical protein
MDNDKSTSTNAAEDPAESESVQGLNIQINTFGELIKNMPVEEINRFLDDRLEDKKLPGEKT